MIIPWSQRVKRRKVNVDATARRHPADTRYIDEGNHGTDFNHLGAPDAHLQDPPCPGLSIKKPNGNCSVKPSFVVESIFVAIPHVVRAAYHTNNIHDDMRCQEQLVGPLALEEHACGHKYDGCDRGDTAPDLPLGTQRRVIRASVLVQNKCEIECRSVCRRKSRAIHR